nr:ankyrin repeat-containing protein [Tanacetum cinerariifolium]
MQFKTFAYLLEAIARADGYLSINKDSFHIYLYTRAEDTLWKMRRFKDNYYSWLLPEIVMILLVPIGILYPIYQLIHLLIVLVLIFPFFMLYSIMWKVLAFVGAALQLQRELQFREEVENIMEPAQLTEVNADNETPEMVFTREHANLVKEGEQRMKTTAESCSITAALIVTIVFAAAITVPGGNNQDTGLPLFKNEVAFNIFAGMPESEATWEGFKEMQKQFLIFTLRTRRVFGAGVMMRILIVGEKSIDAKIQLKGAKCH